MNVELFVVAGIAVMMFLALCIILFVQMYQRRVIVHQQEVKKITEQKELELIQASIQSEESERMRIASELHDDVGATLASVRLFLYKAKDTQYDESVINQSKELLDESITKIRNISHKLQPATLQRLGLELSLQSLLETINRSGTISAAHVVKQKLPRTSENIELAAYRISQELLANIIKHTGATIISVETGTMGNEIVVLFIHNGVGMTQELYEEQIYKKGATGLKNIVNRLKSVNGSLLFYKSGHEWYNAKLVVPLIIEG